MREASAKKKKKQRERDGKTEREREQNKRRTKRDEKAVSLSMCAIQRWSTPGARMTPRRE